MGLILTISAVLKGLIGGYIVVLWARFILDWVRVLNPRWVPNRTLATVFELVYAVTDPPIKMFQRFIPPLRLGAVALDFGWLLTLLSCWLLQAFLP